VNTKETIYFQENFNPLMIIHFLSETGKSLMIKNNSRKVILFKKKQITGRKQQYSNLKLNENNLNSRQPKQFGNFKLIKT
jgi:hypothetical protein